MKDLTATPGNPAHAIQSEYQALMAIDDLDTLRSESLRLLATGGISKANAAKFRRTVATENSTARLRSYLTYFVLAAAGLKVI